MFDNFKFDKFDAVYKVFGWTFKLGTWRPKTKV